jgi:AraC family transcriptional regulator of adaptative response / DNA-3-methyladenine glycosylase II
MGFDIANAEACYRATLRRDARFDGRFYVAVTSTGIYCRPICPAPPAKAKHYRYFPSAAAAQSAGFRPCIRCRPELAPGAAGWDGRDAQVRRAMEFIADGGLGDDRSIEDVARHVGIGSRQLRRLFADHVGASPVQVAKAHKVALAKALLADSDLAITDVAFAAGFNSVRRFNDVFKAMFGRPPSALRRRPAEPGAGTIRLLLPYRPPFDWSSWLGFFGERAVEGVEQVRDDEYRRTFRIGAALGRIRLAPDRRRHHVVAQVRIDRITALPGLVGRLRHMIDADCDPEVLRADLGGDPWLRQAVQRRPGLRIPGAFDGFEQAVRAVLGQQVSVAAARTLAGRIAARWGAELPDSAEPSWRDCPRRLFPSARELTEAKLEEVGVLPSRANTIRALAKAVTENPNMLGRFRPPALVCRELLAIPGIGRWTAEYIALRALGDPDAFPESDLGLLKAARRRQPGMTAAGLRKWAERWRPWRGYAATLLWQEPDDDQAEAA